MRADEESKTPVGCAVKGRLTPDLPTPVARFGSPGVRAVLSRCCPRRRETAICQPASMPAGRILSRMATPERFETAGQACQERRECSSRACTGALHRGLDGVAVELADELAAGLGA